MKRGFIVSVAGGGDFLGKPRPALIVQDDLFNEFHPSITICPISSHLTGDYIYRVPIAQGTDTGLLLDSEVEADKITSVWTRRIGNRMGRAPDAVMFAVDAAMRRWLSL